MSAKELTRVEVLSRVTAGTLSLRSAAQLLAVSYRQARRLARRYRAEVIKVNYFCRLATIILAGS